MDFGRVFLAAEWRNLVMLNRGGVTRSGAFSPYAGLVMDRSSRVHPGGGES
jgi:hypothetical protein